MVYFREIIPSHGRAIQVSELLKNYPEYMVVSKNGGTPKWMVYNGNSYEHG